jgi:homoserine dehydrogenase
MRTFKVGLLGLGTVGCGVAQVLQQNQEVIRERLGAGVELASIADLDLERPRSVEVDPSRLTTNAQEVIKDPEVEIVVELIGGYEPARTFILGALEEGKHIVTANKALLARSGSEIFQAAERNGLDVGFEASVGGGIPIIRSIKEGFAANRILSISCIINGTGNYILSKMTDEGRPFEEVLGEAQERGYAEADPSLDVDGADSAHKLAVLATLAFGTPVTEDKVFTEGIRHVKPVDIDFAREFGYRIKPLAIAKAADGQLEVRVHPTMVPTTNLLSTVDGVLNAILVEGDAVGRSIFIGKGAGALPTASAVVSDIIDTCRNIIKGSSARVPAASYISTAMHPLPIKDVSKVTTEYYLRIMALDRPGVLSTISGILGENDISIASVIQRGRRTEGAVPVVLMTHDAKEGGVQKALKAIDSLDVVAGPSILLRVENSRTEESAD